MSPNALIQCQCGKTQIVIIAGHGTCSVCGRSYVLEATWTPKPQPVAAKAAAA